MKRNILTHIKDRNLLERLLVIFEEFQMMALNIDDYEEFFHVLIHVKPVLFIAEINTLDDPYLKVMKIIKKSIMTRNVPILVVVNAVDQELIEAVSQLDIIGLIHPPIIDCVLKVNIKNALNLVEKSSIIDSHQDMQAVQSVMISSLASLAEYRDPETGEHIKRTQNYVKALAVTLRRKGIYSQELTEDNIEAIYMSVPLHDIGKVGIKDEILLKPGRLTKDEFEVMKSHTILGHEAIMRVGNKLKNSDFLNYAADVAYTHHEKYDGSGYPRGLVGQDIPLVGRLMAVADVYDALISKRIYKDPMTHEEAMEIIHSGRGQHFDPVIVDTAMELERTFNNIAQTYADDPHDDLEHERFQELFDQGLIHSILIVEDSKIVRRVMENQFLAIGLTVHTAVDGEDGLKKIMENDYDLILLDIELPKMNGYEMVAKLGKQRELPLIIAMTATDYNITIEELKALGIKGLILKPVDLNRLASKYLEVIRY